MPWATLALKHIQIQNKLVGNCRTPLYKVGTQSLFIMFKWSTLLFLCLGLFSCSQEEENFLQDVSSTSIKVIQNAEDFFEKVDTSEYPIFNKLTSQQIEYIGNNLHFLPNNVLAGVNLGEMMETLSIEEKRALLEAILGIPVNFEGEIEMRGCVAQATPWSELNAFCHTNMDGIIICPEHLQACTPSFSNPAFCITYTCPPYIEMGL